MLSNVLSKLFKPKKPAEEAQLKPVGNTAELCASIDRTVAGCLAKAIDPDVNVDELSEEEVNSFKEIGYLMYLMARGFHATDEDIEKLKKEVEAL